MSAFEIASAILRLLSNPLIAKELSSIWGYKTRIKRLKTTVESIQAVLLNAEEKRFENRQIRVWLRSLREPFYDAEDLLDEISYVLRRRKQLTSDYNSKLTKEARIFFSHHNQLKFAVKVHWKIKQITEELDAVAKNRRDLGLTERQYVEPIIPASRREETKSYVPEEDVIGRDTDKEAIIGMLFNSSYDSSALPVVISIVGIGGMGKTTLAQLVFNDKRVGDHFQLKLWVYVSDEEFSEKRLVSLILASISQSSANDNQALDQLQRELLKKIEGKKYLLILDNVWNEERTKWLDVRSSLLGGSKESRIIVTTRSRRVSLAMDASTVHVLHGLSDEDAWSLFIKMSFGCSLQNVQERQLDEGLIEIGKGIVKKCANVPLAIRVIGSSLYGQEKSKWQSFKDTELAMIFDAEEEGQNRIMQILRVSYNHLSPPLKRCFSYCALFPKDYEIETERLTRIWIANDCVARSISSHIEDVCEEYFSILVQRCFFQYWLGGYCRVHDLIHDLAKEVSQEEILSIDSSNFLHRQFENKVRHLGIYYGRKHFSDNRMHVEKLFPNNRTFEARKLHTLVVTTKVYLDFQNDPKVTLCKFLRVLDLDGGCFEILPESIGSLINLRYLNLSWNNLIEKLSESITKLWCLEYLLVSNCSKLKEFPKNLKRLVNLKQLSIRGCDNLSCMPHEVGGLTSLYTLSEFFVCEHKNHGQLEDLRHLINLRGALKIKLHNEAMVNIASRGHDGEAVTCLTGMKNLKELCIEFSGKNDVDERTLEDDDDDYVALFEKLQPPTNIEKLELTGYEGKNVPRWFPNFMDYCPNLVYLDIMHFSRFQCLPQISQLQFLKSLLLYSLHNIEYVQENISLDESSRSILLFPYLENMSLLKMPRLKGWWRTEVNGVGTGDEVENNRSYFPRLSSLRIEKCPQLTLFPSILSSNTEFKTDHLNFLVVMPWKLFPTGLKTLNVCDDKMSCYSIFEVEDAFRSIPDSLNYLYFDLCNRLRALPRCMKHLKSLREMSISRCVNFIGGEEEVEELTDEERMMPWKGFKNLEILVFNYLDRLATLPMGIQCVTSLQSIQISDCPYLKEIPEWMPKLSNLKSFEIEGADEILIQRCKEVTGEDWPKIQHIPHVSITRISFN